jgi:hypothetical protein
VIKDIGTSDVISVLSTMKRVGKRENRVGIGDSCQQRCARESQTAVRVLRQSTYATLSQAPHEAILQPFLLPFIQSLLLDPPIL